MEKERDIELIEKYLTNELSSSEKQAFDARLLEDESLTAEFQRRQTAHKALDFMIAANLKKQLSELEEEDKVVSITSRRTSRMRILSIAASLLVLIGVFYFLSSQGTTSRPELAAHYYEQPDYNTQRSSSDTTAPEDELSKGIAALINGEYAQAITNLDSIQNSDPFYILAQYYQGHALYLSKQFDKAEENFDRVSASGDVRRVNEAEWYSLLSCLAQDAPCTQKLDNLLNNTGHDYHDQALAISKRLK